MGRLKMKGHHSAVLCFKRERIVKSSFLLILFLFILSVIITPTYAKEKDMELRLVQVLFRHGARNPIDPYPADPYKDESFWPEGFSQLTKIGKQQHYALGKYFRVRYNNFLNSSYSPYEIYVQASDVDRTLMSAEVDLAGLYPPNSGEVWNDKIQWQPIPVHTKPLNSDNIVRMSAPCPKLQRLIDAFNQGPEMSQIYNENRELFEYLEKNAGKPIRTLQDVDYLYDDLFIENLHNYSLPDWTKKVFPGNAFLNLTALSFKVITWNAEMKRLKAGPLVKELVSHFHEKSIGSEKMDHRRKLFMYSGHDTTVASLLNSLGMYNDIPPPYACAVMLELYRNISSGSHSVKIFYRNDTKSDPYLLTLPGCNSSCPLDSFMELTQSVIPLNWESECESGFLGLNGISLAALILGSFFSVLLIVSMLAVALAKRKKMNNPAYPYLHLQMEDEDA